MPEVRLNPITGDPVLVSPGRSDRPGAWAGPEDQTPPCPFCPGYEDQTPPEIERVGSEDWTMRVVPNKYPALAPCDGTPTHEVIIDSPAHDLRLEDYSPELLADALALCQRRAKAHSAREGCAYVSVFRNDGRSAGQSISHPHAQLLALPFIPTRIARELAGFTTSTLCPLCDALRAELENPSRIVEIDADMITVAPPWSRMPFELMITSKNHQSDWIAIEPERLASALSSAVRRLRSATPGVDLNISMITAPVAGPSRNRFHWYAEILPRLTNVAGYELSTGNWINIVDPVSAAERLRGTSQVGLK